MPTTANFLTAAQWVGVITLISAAVTVLAFILKWGIRFRLVGTTGFLVVLTGGLSALSLVPLTHTTVLGAIRFSRTYDNGSTQAVIGVPPQITQSELDATLRQAANDLYSYGRMGQAREDQLTIRARTIIHPEPGLSKPLYLGQVKRSLARLNDEQMSIDIYQENLAQLPKTNG